ncbi:hypothetical protein MKD33_10265, partial [Chromobacterium piscinae]
MQATCSAERVRPLTDCVEA